jgi:import inner membrane translocase subunit TIM50
MRLWFTLLGVEQLVGKQQRDLASHVTLSICSASKRVLGVDAFLAYMSSFYEIVVYTSAMPGYGEPILEKLDPNGYISHRLYRDATKYEKGVHLKDLSKLNRDLARTIIIDDDPNCFRLQPDNGIRVPPFTGDVNDRYLLDLIPFLEYIVKEDIPDVRPVIASYRGLDIPLEFSKRQQQLRYH